MALETETVAIPISKGINLTSEARLVDPPALLEATNSRLTRGGGSRKRRGHTGVRIKSSAPIPPGVDTATLPWIFGWGYKLSDSRSNGEGDADSCGVSAHPAAGVLRGIAQRDQETVLWTGHSLLSYPPGEATTSVAVSNAVMPHLKAFPVAKVSGYQIAPELADNGVFKVVGWIDGLAGTVKAHYSVYDSVSGSPFVTNAQLPATNPTLIRSLVLGRYVYLIVYDADDSLVKAYAFNQDAPATAPVYASYGECNSFFDVFKVDETIAALAKGNSSNNQVDVTWIGTTGTAYAPFSVNGASGVGLGMGQVAVAVHPVSKNVGVVFQYNGSSTGFQAQCFTPTGTPLASAFAFSPFSSARRISLAPKYLYSTTGHELFDFYYDAKNSVVHRQRISTTATVGAAVTRYNLTLASAAFRVGDRTFAFVGHNSSLQSTWFLADEGLDPVGHADWAIARTYATDGNTGSESPYGTSHVASINWLDNGSPNNYLLHTALGYNVRVPSSLSAVASPTFAEPSVHEVRLDFLPKLRTAQAGRAMYIAGAQVWSYDGAELTEACFHIGPEVAPPVPANGGSLTALGTYFYRVELCYKNAQGEEIRSLSIQTTPVVLTGSQQKLTLTLPTCYTRRKGSYFLIFRNAMVGSLPTTELWLLNSRDPTSSHYVANDPTSAASVTFVDDGTIVSDANIQRNELTPASSTNSYLLPLAPPACELISAGRDRVWVAGGELLPGQIAPSRLFDPGETPAWNPYLNLQVDRSAEALTAVGFCGEVAVFFRKNSTYIMDGDGPDNVAQGVWAPSRLAFADLGALGQESLALIPSGLIFQGPAGFRLMGPGGALTPIGIPTDEFAKTFTVSSAVLVDHDQEARFYGESGALVYNYLYDAWTQWTVSAVGAVRDFTSNLAILAQSDGDLLVEADGVWTDNGDPYTHRIRFPWLHGGSLGDFQRVRAIEGVGTWDVEDGPHTVRVEIYYDERPFAEEVFQWQMPHPIHALPRPLFFPLGGDISVWGDAHWGDGVWGDSESVAGELHDRTWDWKRKLHRQKCAVISIAIEDWGTQGPGFTLNAICLKLAKKPGLNRLPGIGVGSDTYR